MGTFITVISLFILVYFIIKWICRFAWLICKSIYRFFCWVFKKLQRKEELPEEDTQEYSIPSLRIHMPTPQRELTEEEHKKQLEKEIREREEREEREIRRRILERERKKRKEKEVYNKLLEEGLIYPEESNKRPPIPKDVVDAVWRRDKGQCVYCGSKENLQLDHIIPFSKGGATTFENLQLLCQKCNLKKSNHIG